MKKLPLYIRRTPDKGRGVFCKTGIKAGTLIEVSTLLILPAEDYSLVAATLLKDYIFYFDKDKMITALALGFGSLYNHALYPNASFFIDHPTCQISYHALEDIAAGNEICINYDGTAGSDEWFRSRLLPQ